MSWSTRQGGGKRYEIPRFDIHAQLNQPRPRPRVKNLPPPSTEGTATDIPPYMKISTVKVRKQKKTNRHVSPREDFRKESQKSKGHDVISGETETGTSPSSTGSPGNSSKITNYALRQALTKSLFDYEKLEVKYVECHSNLQEVTEELRKNAEVLQAMRDVQRRSAEEKRLAKEAFRTAEIKSREMQKVALVDSVNKERKRWEEVVDGLRNLLRNEREGKEKAVAAALAEAQSKMQADMEKFIDKERERHAIEIQSLEQNGFEKHITQANNAMENQQILHEKAMQALVAETNTQIEYERKLHLQNEDTLRTTLNKEWTKKMRLERERHQNMLREAIDLEKAKHEKAIKDYKEALLSASKDDVANRMSNLENNLRSELSKEAEKYKAKYEETKLESQRTLREAIKNHEMKLGESIKAVKAEYEQQLHNLRSQIRKQQKRINEKESEQHDMTDARKKLNAEFEKRLQQSQEKAKKHIERVKAKAKESYDSLVVKLQHENSMKIEKLNKKLEKKSQEIDVLKRKIKEADAVFGEDLPAKIQVEKLNAKNTKKVQNNVTESSNKGDKDDDWGNVDWPAENSEISEFTGFPSSDPFESNDRRKSRSSSVDRDSPSSHAGVSFNDWDSDFEGVEQNEVVTKDEAFDQETEMDTKAKAADEQDVFSAFDVTNSGDEDDEDDVFDTVLEDSNNAEDANNDIVDDPFAEENFEAAESANPFNSTENPFATAEALETNTDEQGNSGSGWDDIWDKIEGKSPANMPDQEALDPNLLKSIFKKVGRKVCTIKYNGAIAKLTAKGIMFLAGGNTPLFFQDAASFAKFVNTPDTIDANDEESWDATYINEVLDNMFLTPAGRDSDDIQLSLRTIIEKNRTVSRDSTSS